MAVLAVGVFAAGGLGTVIENLRQFPGFLEFIGIAQPVLADGTQEVVNNLPVFDNELGDYGYYNFIYSFMGTGIFRNATSIVKIYGYQRIRKR